MLVYEKVEPEDGHTHRTIPTAILQIIVLTMMITVIVVGARYKLYRRLRRTSVMKDKNTKQIQNKYKTNNIINNQNKIIRK